MEPIEWIGMIASVIIVISFFMKDIYWVRMINIIGAIMMVIYGIVIGAMSVYILNGMLVLVHIYYLVQYIVQKKQKNNVKTQKNTTQQE